MKTLFLASALALALYSDSAAQAKPDFSGTWRMDVSRSESAMYGEPIGPVTAVITQTDREIRVETTTRSGVTTDVFQFKEGDVSLTQGGAVARWRGDTLMMDVVRNIRGQTVTVQQTRQLSANGNEMIVNSILDVQHGYTLGGTKTYGAGKDVFVRVRE